MWRVDLPMMESHCHIMLCLKIFFCSTLFAPGLNGDFIDINEHYNAIKPSESVCFSKSNSSVNIRRDCSREKDCIYSGSKVKLNGEVMTVTEILDTTGTTCNNKSRVMVIEQKTQKLELYIACFFGGFFASLAVVMVILLMKKRLCGEAEQFTINEISRMTPNGFLASGSENAEGDINASAENALEIADRSKPSVKSRRRSSFRKSSIKARSDAMNRVETTKPIDMISNPILVPPEKTYKENYVSSDKLKRHGCVLKDETIYENVKRPGKRMKPYSAEPGFVVDS